MGGFRNTERRSTKVFDMELSAEVAAANLKVEQERRREKMASKIKERLRQKYDEVELSNLLASSSDESENTIEINPTKVLHHSMSDESDESEGNDDDKDDTTVIVIRKVQKKKPKLKKRKSKSNKLSRKATSKNKTQLLKKLSTKSQTVNDSNNCGNLDNDIRNDSFNLDQNSNHIYLSSNLDNDEDIGNNDNYLNQDFHNNMNALPDNVVDDQENILSNDHSILRDASTRHRFKKKKSSRRSLQKKN